ncbi:MAG: TQO small subunit DoxD [Leptolyngbyaceae cyanobacterium bins.349]|nr:TQO small subunit DoxD [Leptolyngbyaceae cyanobacterium bins.349]
MMATPQPVLSLRRKDVTLAYVLLRILFGIGFLIIGLGKIGNIGGFANAMAEQFKATFLPADLVRATAVIVPPLEVVVGLLLILGLFTRGALIAGFILMMILHTGVTLLKDWNTAANQLVYCIIFFLLLAGAGFNAFSIDQWLARKRQDSDSSNTLTSDMSSFTQQIGQQVRQLIPGQWFVRKRSRKRLQTSSNIRH